MNYCNCRRGRATSRAAERALSNKTRFRKSSRPGTGINTPMGDPPYILPQGPFWGPFSRGASRRAAAGPDEGLAQVTGFTECQHIRCPASVGDKRISAFSQSPRR